MNIPDQITNHVTNHELNPDPNCVYCNGLIKPLPLSEEAILADFKTITDDYEKGRL